LIYDDLPQCGYEGGQLTFDAPPSGTSFRRTSRVARFLCSATAPECDPAGVGQYLSIRTDYVVNHNDANAACANPTDIRGVCRYQNGTSHRDADEEFPIGAETPACTPVRYCGDNILQTGDGEACDPPGSPAGNNGNNCRADCTVCGDGRQDAGEACDDGNGVDTDGCRNNCTIPVCGDSIVDYSHGEACDPPGSPAGTTATPAARIARFAATVGRMPARRATTATASDTDGCRNNCTIPGLR
jgi:cysteine-rich repeat protein